MKDFTSAHAGVLITLIPIALQFLDSLGVHLTAECVSQLWVAGVAAVGGITLYLAHNKAAGLTTVGGVPKV